jgi:hypothetical protein
MTKRKDKAQEALLLYTVYETLIYPIREEIGEDMGQFMDDATILCLAFGLHEKREVFRRRVMQQTRIEGLWWGSDELKKFGSRSIMMDARNTPWLYLRVDPRDKGSVDIEVRLPTSKGPHEWMTCTVTPQEYKRLDGFLGPREDICVKPSHKEDEENDPVLEQITARLLGQF